MRLDNKSGRFYENMAKFLGKPVEEILENTLSGSIELMSKIMEMPVMGAKHDEK